MTPTQNKIRRQLNDLIHSRFNVSTLEKKLSNIFHEDIKLELSDNEDISDWNYIFESHNPFYGGVFDIYFLKQQSVGFDKSDIYITEVNCEFDKPNIECIDFVYILELIEDDVIFQKNICYNMFDVVKYIQYYENNRNTDNYTINTYLVDLREIDIYDESKIFKLNNLTLLDTIKNN